MSGRPELEERICYTCGIAKFRCLPTSQQMSCSRACNLLSMTSTDRHKWLKQEQLFQKAAFGPQKLERERAYQKKLLEEEMAYEEI